MIYEPKSLAVFFHCSSYVVNCIIRYRKTLFDFLRPLAVNPAHPVRRALVKNPTILPTFQVLSTPRFENGVVLSV